MGHPVHEVPREGLGHPPIVQQRQSEARSEIHRDCCNLGIHHVVRNL